MQPPFMAEHGDVALYGDAARILEVPVRSGALQHVEIKTSDLFGIIEVRMKESDKLLPDAQAEAIENPRISQMNDIRNNFV